MHHPSARFLSSTPNQTSTFDPQPNNYKMEWESFFRDLSTFIISIADREEGATASTAESVLVRIVNFLYVLYAIKASLHDGNGGDGELLDTLATVSGLLRDLEEINARWICIESGLSANASRLTPEEVDPRLLLIRRK